MRGMQSIAALVAVGMLNGASGSAAKWRAILEPVGGATVRGGATAEATGDSTHFVITIRGGAPNTSLAWHMHTGTCASPGQLQGSGYPPLKVGPGGTAQAAVTLAVASPDGGSRIIQVHGAGGNVVSCGELKPVGGT